MKGPAASLQRLSAEMSCGSAQRLTQAPATQHDEHVPVTRSRPSTLGPRPRGSVRKGHRPPTCHRFHPVFGTEASGSLHQRRLDGGWSCGAQTMCPVDLALSQIYRPSLISLPSDLGLLHRHQSRRVTVSRCFRSPIEFPRSVPPSLAPPSEIKRFTFHTIANSESREWMRELPVDCERILHLMWAEVRRGTSHPVYFNFHTRECAFSTCAPGTTTWPA